MPNRTVQSSADDVVQLGKHWHGKGLDILHGHTSLVSDVCHACATADARLNLAWAECTVHRQPLFVMQGNQYPGILIQPYMVASPHGLTYMSPDQFDRRDTHMAEHQGQGR